MISETSTTIYGSSQNSLNTNYSYDDSWKLVSTEQYDGANNWTIYQNYTYDDRGNKIVKEYNRVGNSPWATITTFTWGYGVEQSDSQTEQNVSSTEDDSSSNLLWILLLIILILVIASFVFSGNNIDVIGTLIEKVIKGKFEEE